MYEMTYTFGTEKKNGACEVKASDLYGCDREYGFVAEENRRVVNTLQFPELSDGFDTAYWFRDYDLTKILQDQTGCSVSARQVEGHEIRDGYIPLHFKAEVPRIGNYEITVTIQHKSGIVLLFAGPRRLYYALHMDQCKEVKNAQEPSSTAEKTETIQKTFSVNVCDIIPRGKESVYEKRSIDVTMISDQASLVSIDVREVNCPTIYIAGDSTVTDQSAEYPYHPGSSYSGWGQMLSAYLTEQIAVSNHAHSGLTTESFRMEGHYAIIQAHIKPGDYLFIQFAHNDQKLPQLKAEEGYRQNLIHYIEEAQRYGAFPVLVTPLARNTWKADDGTYNDFLEEYAETVKKVGKELQIPVIDLHEKSMLFVKEHGLEASKPYFFPNDYTHSNDYGAYVMAGFVKDEIRKECSNLEVAAYQRLVDHLTEGFGTFAMPDQISVPEAPDYMEHVENPNSAVLFADLERPKDMLTRVEALDMVIQAARFFPTNVFNDIYTDIVGHEWFAGTVQCAYQNGLILPEMVTEQRFEPERHVTLQEFLVFAMGGYKSRRGLPEASACSLDAQTEKYARPYVRAAYQLGAVKDGDICDAVITREDAAQICRKLNI